MRLVLAADLGELLLDAGGRGRGGLVVSVDRHLELALAHGTHQGLVVGQLQGADGRVERFPELSLVRGRRPDRLRQIGDPGRLAVGTHDARLLLPVGAPRRGLPFRRRNTPGLERPRRRLYGQPPAELGLTEVEHLLRLADLALRPLGRPVSPGRRPPPLGGLGFSQAAVQHCGNRVGAGERPAGDRVEGILDPPAADLVGPELLKERRSLGVLQVALVLPRADPLPDGAVDQGQEEEEVQTMLAVFGKVKSEAGGSRHMPPSGPLRV